MQTWLKDQARLLRKGKLRGRWLVHIALCDAYERGYNHGYYDKRTGNSRT